MKIPQLVAKNKKSRPICPECDGKVVYHRKKDDKYVCRRCGNEFEWQNKKSEAK
jgi:ribosomal protein L37AE/L43A